MVSSFCVVAKNDFRLLMRSLSTVNNLVNTFVIKKLLDLSWDLWQS